MDFKTLKKNSGNFDRLLKSIDTMNGGAKFEKDEGQERYWKPSPDKAGNALAVIRFLPGPAVDGTDALPWVRYFDHGFQCKETGKYYIEKSLTTFGEADPVAEYNSKLWNSTSDDNSPERKQARDQKRRLHYVSLIYVVSDPKNPENEGKVFYYRYGKKIMDKIQKMMKPDLESEAKIDPTDLWKGANFKLKMTRQSGFPNYDESVFLAPGPLLDDDEAMEKVWQTDLSLLDVIDRRHFKTYDELKKRFEDALGISTGTKAPVKSVTSAVLEENLAKVKAAKVVEKDDEEESPPWNSDDEDDEDLKMFHELAKD